MKKYFNQPASFYKSLGMLALPIMLQNLINQTLMLADTFMVGALGEAELSAVTLANTPFFIIMLIMFGLQSGSSILISQYWGKNDQKTISRVIGVGCVAAVAVTTLLATTFVLFPYQVMGLVTNNQELIPIAVRYGRIVAFSYVINSVSLIYVAAQRSTGNAKCGIVVLSTSMVLNVFLNYVLIFGELGFPEMGVEGAALATLISRCCELVIAVIYSRFDKHLTLFPKLMFHPGKLIIRDFIRYSSPVIFNETLWGIGFSLYPVIIGHMADSQSAAAAYTIAGNVEKIFFVLVIGVSSASAVVLGRELGSGRDKAEVYNIGVLTCFLCFGVGLLCLILLFVLTSWVIGPVFFPMFNLSAIAIEHATAMLYITALTVPFRALNHNIIVGVLRCGGDTKAAMALDVGALYLVGVPIAAFVGLVLQKNVIWVYAVINFEEIIKCVATLWRFRTKKWLNNLTRSADQIEAKT